MSKLLKSLKKLPSNVVINTSKDNMSVYNILETDINLNSWSSVGLESSILGIPTFSFNRLFYSFS